MENSPLIAEGINMKGGGLHFSNPTLRLSADNFIVENQAQEFSGMHVEKNGYASTLVMDIPSVHLSANFDSLLTGKLHFKSISLGSPTIDYKTITNTAIASHPASSLAAIKIDHLAIQEPIINVTTQLGGSPTKFSLPYSKGSEMRSDGIILSSEMIDIVSLKIKTKKASLINTKDSIAVDEGIDASLAKINIPPGRQQSRMESKSAQFNSQKTPMHFHLISKKINSY